MATNPSSWTPIPESTYAGVASKKATPFLSTMVRAMQMGCLMFIPIFAVSLIFFLSIFTIKCDGSSGFIVSQSGEVNCVSSTRDTVVLGRETQHVIPGSDVMSDNGRVVMTVTRVVLISVSALIVSFTAWICVWYQLYGKPGTSSGGGSVGDGPPALAVPGSSGVQVPLESVLTIRVNEFLAKEDMERLLGPDHSAAPAV